MLIIRGRYSPTAPKLLASLLEYRAPLNTADTNGDIPLHHALSRILHTLIARFLVKKGANPRIANAKGDTPAHAAASVISRAPVPLGPEYGPPPRSKKREVLEDASRHVNNIFALLAAASGNPNLFEVPNAAGEAPSGISKVELKRFDQRIDNRIRGPYRGRGRGRGRGG